MVQGDKTVVKYEKKSIELAKYAIAFISNEDEKCKHFKEGVRTSI